MSDDLHVFVSVDMEGVAALCHRDETSPANAGTPAHEAARRLMTLETNAAIEGAFAGGATAVTVNDAHASMRNLLPELLDRRARLIRGAIKPSCMMEGVGPEHAGALLIGCHARAGEGRGVLSHTLDGGQIHRLEIDGVVAGEIRLSALLAGARGVPVLLVTGDEAACAEASDLLGADLQVFATKSGIDRNATLTLSPDDARDGIRAAAERAVAGRSQRRPLDAAGPVEVTCEWVSATAAHVAAWVPGVRLTAPRTTTYRADDVHAATALLQVLLLAGASAVGR